MTKKTAQKSNRWNDTVSTTIKTLPTPLKQNKADSAGTEAPCGLISGGGRALALDRASACGLQLIEEPTEEGPRARGVAVPTRKFLEVRQNGVKNGVETASTWR